MKRKSDNVKTLLGSRLRAGAWFHFMKTVSEIQDAEKNIAARQKWIQRFDKMTRMLRGSEWSADIRLKIQELVPELENIAKEIQESEKNDTERQIWIQNIDKIMTEVAAIESKALGLSSEKDGYVIEDAFGDQKDDIDPEDTTTKNPLLTTTTLIARAALLNDSQGGHSV
jgi:hypothetical protein